jgi:hypothetical protein
MHDQSNAYPEVREMLKRPQSSPSMDVPDMRPNTVRVSNYLYLTKTGRESNEPGIPPMVLFYQNTDLLWQRILL